MSKRNVGKKAAKVDTKGKPKAKATAKKPVRKAAKASPVTKKAKAKPRASARKPPGEKGCNTPSRADVFVQEYLIDLNGRQAAIRAGFAPDSARQRAAEMLATAPVKAKLEQAMAERAERTGISADRVLERWWAVATADARDLTELHRCGCRYCWGTDHHFQRTPQELREALEDYQTQIDTASDSAAAARVKVVDQVGGCDYNPRKDPNPACPECFGQGVEVVVAKDTRDLSPAARMLYAGVKTTQNGLEIKTHSQGDALTNVAKHLGMLATRLKVGSNDNPEDDEDVTGFVLIPAKRVRGNGEDS